MPKRKLFENVDELFVKKPTWTSVTKTVGIQIPEFLKKIDKKEKVKSPRFKLAGVEFYIRIFPGIHDSEFVGVDLVNSSNEDQTTSVTFTAESGIKGSWRMETVTANHRRGFCHFLPHEDYKACYGDMFKLRAKVTLHQKLNTAEDSWIRSVVIL